ncbi:hypothetical protein C3B51_19715 [Pseudoalteromonas rubra]|uniref:Uncharacterized protein n=1 Tax=Pseudoalteromonas rubra TaxID=43658 RepID=A0A4Q7DZW1_9GAMM|nr:hypothetical protein [Pseudoalteromonas rubra]RZM74388.1 hypothetical protein C3B51_19715 [Pseudoalteromonas rubra]
MTEYKLEIFADYNQVYLHDATVEVDFADDWDVEAYKNMASMNDGALGIATARNMDVPVDILVYAQRPDLDFEQYEHVVSCGVDFKSGVLVVHGPSDYLPDAKRITVSPGYYAVYVLSSGLNTVSEDGLKGDDIYKVILWPCESPKTLKLLKDSGFNS